MVPPSQIPTQKKCSFLNSDFTIAKMLLCGTLLLGAIVLIGMKYEL